MIVMKFGGTSVGSAEAIRRVGQVVQSRLDSRPVLVVSALSGVTNALIEAARGAQKRKAGPEKSAAKIAERHRAVLRELGLPASLVDGELKRLEEVLKGIFYLRELTARSLDYVLSFGEAMSSRIVAGHLCEQGIAAKAWMGWDAGILTDDNHGEAAILPETWNRVKQKLGSATAEVPVVTGFLGRTKSGERSTLGRGGSDYSAAIVGRAIGAEEIQIWTDVSGILSADPRIVDDAYTLRQLTFAEAAELAYFGAKVLHPRTVEPAVDAGIPVRIVNTFDPEDEGTLVVAERSEESPARVVEGLAVKKGISLVNVTSTRMLGAEGYMARVFEVLRRHDVSVDAIATSEVSISLTVDPRFRVQLDAALAELGKIAKVRLWQERSIVAVVGEGMQVHPGVAARVFAVLGRAGVNIEMISQGASELNITFVVEDAQADLAMRELHEEFLAGRQRVF